MKYSIIIPVYNAEKTIDRCLKSIVNQDFKDYEIILIDDGSRDKSLKICREWAEKDSRIKALHKENGGASSARNTGLDEAKGDYILFVDSDDYVADNYFDELEKHSADNALIVFTNYWETADSLKKREINGTLNGCGLFDKVYYLILSRTVNGPCSKIFDRSLLERNKLRFDERIPVAEDFNFCLAYLMKCKNVEIYDISVYYNDMTNDNSLTRGSKKGLIDVYPVVFDVAYRTIADSDYSENEKKKMFTVWDKLHTDSFGTCVMEEIKDKDKTPTQIRKEIKNMCVKFYSKYPGGYGYQNLIHLIMRICIKYKMSGTLYILGKYYMKMRG